LLIITQILFIALYQRIYSQGANYQVLKVVSGSGGVIFSTGGQYVHLATAGETIAGQSQNPNQLVLSGFWDYLILKPTPVDDNRNLSMPDKFLLHQNYPNPFNPATTIIYTIPKASFVIIKVFDLLGREVGVLVNEQKAAGNYRVQFNPSNLTSGIYFYRMQAGDFVQTKKLVLIK
jgi:hypothetical protein